MRNGQHIYSGWLNQHIIAHGVVDSDRKKAYFLSWVGPETYELINKLFSASELNAASFDDVTGKLDEHFKQSLHEQAASYQFYQCKMKPGQTCMSVPEIGVPQLQEDWTHQVSLSL